MTARTAAKTDSPAALLHASKRNAARRRAALRRQPRLSRLLAWLLSAVLGSAGMAHAQVPSGALPTGGRVVVGSGQVQQSGNLLIVNQGTQRLGMDWQSFNIGSAATVEFRQPGASSIALNRVVGNSGSEIYGRLRANGQVFLTNPNGVLFAPGAQVDVGGLVASTLDLSQQDFANGTFIFKADGNSAGSSSASVVNQGTLRASAGGYLALFGNRVDNQGDISVDAGAVVLASGRAATVSISGSGLISAVVTPGAAGSVSNSGSITADGGVVTMTAQSAQDIAASLVNNSGIVRANTLVERNGEVWITGDHVATSGRISADATGSGNAGRVVVKGGMQTGSVQVGGTVTAQADSGRGGEVETSAAHVSIGTDTRVNTLSAAGTHGTWTIDPLDFTVAAGGGASTSSGIGASTLSTNLNSGNVSLVTAAGVGSEPGDIHVNAAVSWTAGTTLTLAAARNVNINANLTATGIGAALVMSPGNAGVYTLASAARITLSGLRSGLQVAGITYTMVRDINELQAISASTTTRAGNYALANDIDATGSGTLNNNTGYSPIGDNSTFSSNNSFRGRFDGLGHEVTGLVINRPANSFVGLFGVVHDATIRNLQFTGGSVTGGNHTGALAGYVGSSSVTGAPTTIVNVRSSASVLAPTTNSNFAYAGGLVGLFQSTNGLIDRSSSSAAVSSASNFALVGGLVGQQSTGSISNSSASGAVESTATTSITRSVGGLVGRFDSVGSITGSTASGGVVSASEPGHLGGLVGYQTAGNIDNSSASGTVTATAGSSNRQRNGGLVGFVDGAATITNSSASSIVTGGYYAGGLVGHYGSSGAMTAVGASGAVTGINTAGGLVGWWETAGSITGAQATGNVLGTDYVGGLIGYGRLSGSLTGATASGTVTGPSYVGGLVGYLQQTGIANSSASGLVTATATAANNNTVYAGGLVGYFSNSLSGGQITNSSATGNVNSAAPYGNVGGLVGLMNAGSVAGNSSASGRVEATHTTLNGRYVGGLIGNFDGTGSLSNVSATGAVSGGVYAGGLVGQYGSTGNVSTARADGNVTGSAFTGAQYVGGLIGQMNSGGTITASEAHGNVSSNHDGGGLVGHWSNSGNISDSRATGDVSSPFATGGVGGLVGYGNGGGGVLRTINNSSATGNVSGGQYTGGLAGVLYYASVTRGTAGSATSPSTVNASADSSAYVGGLVGYYYGVMAGAQIANSTAFGSVFADSSNSYAGGLVGAVISGSVISSTASGSVTGRDSLNANSSQHYVGGLVGQFSGAGIADSAATGAVTGRYYTGGLVGQYNGTDPLSNSSATGNVTGTQYVGGLVGYHTNAGITNGFASGAVNSTLTGGYAGGLVGYAYTYSATGSAINDSRATGAVTGGTYTGGLIGHFDDYTSAVNSSGGVSNSSASGAVAGLNFAGGLVGQYHGAYATNLAGISNSRASGTVQGSTQVGGLVGQFQGHGGIRDSAATGHVLGVGSTSTQQLGGLVGTFTNAASSGSAGLLTRSYATGNVRLSSTATLGSNSTLYAGGLVGYLSSNSLSTNTLSDSYATGAVTVTSTVGRWSAGGLVGLANNASLTRAYATGAVTVPTGSLRLAGGLVGQRTSSGTVTSSFWATDTTGQATSAGGTASTLATLKLDATYPSDWDVATTGGTAQVWRIYDGQTAPLLRSFLTPLSVTLADVNKVYDGTTSLGSAAIVVNGTPVANPERILVAGVSSHAGTYGLTAANVYSVQNGYDLQVAGTANLTIAPRPLTLAGLAANKVYDSTLAATVSANPQFGGLVAGEDLSFLPGSGFALQFASKTVGNGKTVNISGSYTLANGTTGRASDYVLPTVTTTTANITPATLTAGSFSATSRAYDGTTTVAVSVAATAPSGVLGGDDVTIDLSSVNSGSVANRNVGSGKAVTVSGVSLGGADALNYTLAGLNAVSVNITPKPLTVNGISAADRAYDRSVNVSLSTAALSLAGLVTGDEVQSRLTGLAGTVADKNVGTAKPVTVTGLGLRGVDAGNYLAVAGAVNVTITPRAVNLLLTTNAQTNRVYDGTTTASVLFYNSYYQSTGSIWGGDSVTISTTSLGYNDKNVAYNTSGVPTNKPITASGISISGTDATNWAVQNTSTGTQGTITPKPLSVSGVTATNRVYDGTRDVAVTLSGATVDTTAVVGSDVVGVATPGTGSVTGQMVNKNAGNAKAVTVPGLALTGADAGNYSITSGTGGGVTVNIAQKDVAVSYTASDKVYDSGTTVRTAATTTDFISGDVVSFISNDYVNIYYGYNPWANFTGTGARNVGTGKTVTLTFEQLTSTDATNYRLANTALAGGTAALTTTASITPKPVTLAFSSASRVYDGSTNAVVTLNIGGSGVYSVDALSTTQTAAFTGAGAKDVGTNKPITVSGISLSGTGAGNYTVGNTTAIASGAVTPKPITVSGITATDRAYDGTTTVAVTAGTVTSAGFVPLDVVGIGLPSGGLNAGTIANKNVGLSKPVTVTGLTLTGADAPNYSIDASGSGITVNISQLALTPTYTGVSRVYNGGVSVSVTPTTAGIASGDAVTFSQQAIFTGANARDVGTARPINISNIVIGGAGAANYSLAGTTASASADITPKPVTAGYSGASRVYNGLLDVSAAVVGSSLQFVAGDNVGLTETARFTGDGSAGVNKAVSISGISLTGAQMGNYSLINSTASTTATITQRPLGVAGVTATHRVYDGTTLVTLNITGATVDTSNLIAGDRVGVTLPGTGNLDDRNAGVGRRVNISGGSLTDVSAANYVLNATGLTVNIAPKSLTAVFGGVNRVYDGTADALVTATSGDILAIDALSLGFNAQGLFSAGKNVGTGKAVSVISAFLTGASRDNYLLANTTGSTSADITPRQLTANYGGGNKVYDGSTSAVVTGTLANRIAGDNVLATETAVFTGSGARNVGNGKPISVSNIALAGSDAGNYTLFNTTDTTTGSITPKPITVSGLTNVVATDRVYDGTRVVAVTVPTGVTLVPNSSDIISGDVVTIDVPVSGVTTGSVANKNVGNGKAVTVDGLTLSGTDAANYSIGGTAGISVNFTPKSLTAAYSGVNRVYDGSTTASVTGASTDLIIGDSLLIRGSGSFTGLLAKNVGTAKAINITGANLSGTDAGNYTLVNSTGSATADVTQRSITPTYTGGSRVYDGSTAAPVSSSTANFVVGDNIALTQSASFTGSGARNAGTGKAVQITSITLTGSDAVNYRLLTSNASTLGTITPKPISLTGLTGVTANDRVYDGTRTVGVTVTSSGSINVNPADIVAGDIVDVVPPTSGLTTGTMLNKNAGLNKALVVDGLALTGADAGNYTVSATNGITVNITPKSLVAVYTGVNRVYDGTAAATVVGSSTDMVAGDSLSINGSGVFSAGKNAGTGKAITVTAGLLGSTDAANYTLLNNSGNASADITPRTATASFMGGTRVYDGTTAAPVSGTLGGLISGDSVGFSQTAVFSGTGARNVGSGKTVDVSGITLTGSDAINYSLLNTSTSTTGSITQRPLGVLGLTGVTATDRAYDGTRTVAVTVSSTGTVTLNPADLIAGDLVTISAPPTGQTTGTLADKNVGAGKAVAVVGLTLGGADAGNYSVASTSGVTVNITPKNLTASYAGISRVYDGTTAATASASSADIVAGDSVVISATGVFSGGVGGFGARNAGVGKTIDVQNGALSSTDAGNYSLVNPTGTANADITPLFISASYTGGTRVYDGTTAAAVTRSAAGFIAGDAVSVSETAVFSGTGAKNVGDLKPVLVSGISLSGADAANYELTHTSATTTGGITPRPLNVTGLSGITAVDRVYDGTVDVQVNVSGALGTASGDVIAGDNVVVNLPGPGLNSGTMANKHAGLNKSVVLTGMTLGGADAINYALAGITGLSVNITPKTLTASYSGANKVYDGSTAATITGSSADLVAGDAVTIAATGAFTGNGARNVGTAKPVTVQAATLSGADAGDYTLVVGNTSTTADITPRAVTATYAGGTRVYDGTATAPVQRTDAGLLAGDTVAITETAVFTGSGARNVGAGKGISITAITLSGADAGNYALVNSSASSSGSITPRPFNVTGLSGITATDRVYDGSTAVQVSISGSIGSLSGVVIAGDIVTVNVPGTGLGSAVMLDKNAGLNKSVVLSGLYLSGADAANYAIAGTAGVSVNIAQATLTLSGISAVDRVYDGTLLVAINTAGGSISGAIAGDNLQLLASGVTAGMANKHAGQGKTVNVSGLSLGGSDAGNYTVAGGSGLTVNIAQRALNPGFTVADKVYDGTTGASITLSSDLVAGDSVNVTAGNAAFASRNAGAGVAVAVTGLSMTGADAGNYLLSSTTLSGAANINRAALAVSANSITKVYGDTLNLAGSEFSAIGLVAGETLGQVTLSSSGAANTAAASTSPYALIIGSASGGSFNPLNYDVAYRNGQVQVNARPLIVAVNSLVRFSGEANPAGSFGLSTNAGGLVNGDTLTPGQTAAAPAGSNGAAGVAIYALLPSSVSFSQGNASNYALSFSAGQLLVLPRPPLVGETDLGGGGGVNLALAITPEQIQQGRAELDRASEAVRTALPSDAPRAPVAAAPLPTLTPAQIAMLLSGDGQRITLPELQKMPLIVFDPQLRRLMQSTEAAR